MTGIILIVVLIIGFSVLKKHRTDNYVRSILEIMESHYNFHPTYYQIMANNSGAIALDASQRLLCVINEHNTPYYINRRQIIDTEILIDQVSYHQKDFFKTWSKYIILKSIASESTAEAAVHISKEKHVNKIKKIELRIGTNNFNVPNHYLLFLKNGTEKHKRKVINDIYDWITRVESIKNTENNRFRING